MSTHDWDNVWRLFDRLVHLCSEENRRLMEGFLLGDLDGPDMKFWQAHVDSCNDCKSQVQLCDQVGATYKREWPEGLKFVSGVGLRSRNLRELEARFMRLKEHFSHLATDPRDSLDFLLSYISDQIPSDEKAEWDKHVSGCHKCTKLVRNFRESMECVRNLSQ